MKSLRQRLSRGLTAVLCGIFVLHWLAADWTIRNVAEKQISNRLADDAYSLLERLRLNNDQLLPSATAISSAYRWPWSGHYFWVKIDATPYPSQSLQDFELNIQPLAPEQVRIDHLSGPQQHTLLVYSLCKIQFGHRVSISVAEDLSSIDHDITTLRLQYLGLSLAVLVIALVLLDRQVKRSLQPLRQVRNELAQVGQGEREQITAQAPTEIEPLVDEINRLLAQTLRRLQHSRTAIGNLAHALKTPIASLFRLADEPELAAYPELRYRIDSQTELLHRCIERELKRARIAGERQVTARFNPLKDLTALKKTLLTIHAEKSLTIEIQAADRPLAIDREDMLELAGNLLDNACKWATKRIDVKVAIEDGLTLRVADDGPGCSAENRASLAKRGHRLDESVAGHGLGLAIVADIVASYHGALQFEQDQALDGLLVIVRLPITKSPGLSQKKSQ